MVASPDPQRVVGRDGFPEGSSLGKHLNAKIAPFHSGSSVSPGMKSQFFPIPRNQGWEFLPGHGLDKVVTPRLPTERLGLQMCQCTCALGGVWGCTEQTTWQTLACEREDPTPLFLPLRLGGFPSKAQGHDLTGRSRLTVWM